MTAPGYQVVNYPVQAKLASTNGVVFENVVLFTFPTVPTGLAWTVSLLPCAPNTSLAGGYVNTAWELRRNNQPEISWFGNTILTDLQAVGGDSIEVIAYNVPVPTWGDPTYDPTSNLLTMRGRSESINAYVPTAPWFSDTGDSIWWATYNPLTLSVVATDPSPNLFPGWPGDGTALVGLQMSATLGANAGQSGNGTFEVRNTLTGQIYGQLALSVGSGETNAQSVYIPSGPTVIPAGSQLEITWNGISGVAQRKLTAVAYIEPY